MVLFINIYENDDLEMQIYEVLRAFLAVNMLNVNVISYRKDTNIVQTSTFYPYQDGNCANIVDRLSTFDECEYHDGDDDNYFSEVRQIKELHRKIPSKLHNCPLNISGAIAEPYVFYDASTDDFQKGTEVLMVRTIAEALQMTPIFLLINETRENRNISNTTGIYSNLFQR